VTAQQFKTAPSPFKADNTASGRCGFTLMNNQVGEVVAEVMATKPNVTVTALPSMMRVDAVGRMDVVYDEISEALGEEPGYFDAADDRPVYLVLRHDDDPESFVVVGTDGHTHRVYPNVAKHYDRHPAQAWLNSFRTTALARQFTTGEANDA